MSTQSIRPSLPTIDIVTDTAYPTRGGRWLIYGLKIAALWRLHCRSAHCPGVHRPWRCDGASPLEDDGGNGPQRNENAMLTPTDIDTLNTLARDLAQRSFGGAGSVGRNTHGTVRLTILKHERGAGGLY